MRVSKLNTKIKKERKNTEKIKSLPLYIHIISIVEIGSKFSLAVTVLDSSSS